MKIDMLLNKKKMNQTSIYILYQEKTIFGHIRIINLWIWFEYDLKLKKTILTGLLQIQQENEWMLYSFIYFHVGSEEVLLK